MRRAAMGVVVFLVGCVGGQPFAPEMCEVHIEMTDTAVIVTDTIRINRCPDTTIRTGTRR